MNSERLPGKVLKPIIGVPSVLITLKRLSLSKYIDELILATTNRPDDDVLYDTVSSAGFKVFRGEGDDVLKRYYECARSYIHMLSRPSDDGCSADLSKSAILSKPSGADCIADEGCLAELSKSIMLSKPSGADCTADEGCQAELSKSAGLSKPAELDKPAGLSKPTVLDKLAGLSNPTVLDNPTGLSKSIELSKPAGLSKPTVSGRSTVSGSFDVSDSFDVLGSFDVSDNSNALGSPISAGESFAVFRVTGDCPLVDPVLTDDLLFYYLSHSSRFDYVRVDVPDTVPRGFDGEAFSYEALEKAYSLVHSAKDGEGLPFLLHDVESTRMSMEHVTYFIYNHPDVFRIGRHVWHKPSSRNYRLCIDTEEDYRLVSKVFEHFGHIYPSYEEIIKYLDAHPEVAQMNSSIKQRL